MNKEIISDVKTGIAKSIALVIVVAGCAFFFGLGTTLGFFTAIRIEQKVYRQDTP